MQFNTTKLVYFRTIQPKHSLKVFALKYLFNLHDNNHERNILMIYLFSSQTATEPPRPLDPCNLCAPTAQCFNGECRCPPDYIGNPYESCRPECVLNTDCPRDKACLGSKCSNPCVGTCAQNAICTVVNHIPSCSCPEGFTGDPFSLCRVYAPPPAEPTDPCQPSPCGPNSQCRNAENRAICSCLPEMINSPPNCRPQCVVNSECSLTEACVNNKCVNPCQSGTCGNQARCEVINNSPICSCREGTTGRSIISYILRYVLNW